MEIHGLMTNYSLSNSNLSERNHTEPQWSKEEVGADDRNKDLRGSHLVLKTKIKP